MEYKLKVLYIKCPHCGEVSMTDQWGEISFYILLNLTETAVSFDFDNKPEISDYLMCPMCKSNVHYLDVVETMMKELKN